MADMPDYVSHGAMSRVDQVSVVKLTHKYDFVTCFVTTLQTVCYPCKQSVQMTSLLTFRRPYGEVFGRILGKVVGGGRWWVGEGGGWWTRCRHAGSHSWSSFELPEKCQPPCLPQAQVHHRILDCLVAD